MPDESVERGSMGGEWQWEGYGSDGRWVNEVCSVVEGGRMEFDSFWFGFCKASI